MRFFAAGYVPPKFVELTRSVVRSLGRKFHSAKVSMEVANKYQNRFGNVGARSRLDDYFSAVDALVDKDDDNPLDSRKSRKKKP